MEFDNINNFHHMISITPTEGKPFEDYVNRIRAASRELKQYKNLFISIRTQVLYYARKFFPDKIYNNDYLQKNESTFFTDFNLIIGSAIVPSYNQFILEMNVMNYSKNNSSNRRYNNQQSANFRATVYFDASNNSGNTSTKPQQQNQRTITSQNLNKFNRPKYKKRGFIYNKNKKSQRIYGIAYDPDTQLGQIN